MRFLFRIFALIALSVAVISAVVDIARSLSASSLVLTSLHQGWGNVAPSSLAFFQVFIQENLPSPLVEMILGFVFNIPAAAVFVTLAALFYSIGAKRAKPFGQISSQ